MPARSPVISIDGPAGAGKSATARSLSRRLGFTYVDTGALYRSVALFARRKGISFEDQSALSEMASGLEFLFKPFEGDLTRIVVNGQDVSEEIRSPEMTKGSSLVSRHPEVRSALMMIQRHLASGGGVVMEGRDIGSVVLPDADLKVFITARPEVRAERRYQEMLKKGFDTTFDQVLEEQNARDARDENRPVSPLKPARDAWILDTPDLSLDEVTDSIVSRLKAL